MLNIGDKVFMSEYGAGIVKSVENKEILGIVKTYIDIYLFLYNMNLLIPNDRIENYKIRMVSSREEVEKALSAIKRGAENIEKKWTRRYRKNNDKIDSGDIDNECEVIAELYHLKREGIMPPGEQKILDKAEGMLSSEIMLVYDISMEEARKIIRKLSE